MLLPSLVGHAQGPTTTADAVAAAVAAAPAGPDDGPVVAAADAAPAPLEYTLETKPKPQTAAAGPLPAPCAPKKGAKCAPEPIVGEDVPTDMILNMLDPENGPASGMPYQVRTTMEVEVTHVDSSWRRPAWRGGGNGGVQRGFGACT